MPERVWKSLAAGGGLVCGDSVSSSNSDAILEISSNILTEDSDHRWNSKRSLCISRMLLHIASAYILEFGPLCLVNLLT